VGGARGRPARPVVALIGDGSAMYNFQALWTAAHENVAVAFIILNNSSYRILKQRVHALRGHAAQSGRYVAMDFTEPPIDFVGLARSLGVQAERTQTLDAVRDALARALVADGPTLIDVELDRSFKPL
jgi:benzoylformate decarboxylase